MSKPKASIASVMLTTGEVEKSSEKLPAEQGRTIHKLNCRMLYVGDSVGHGANLKHLATILKCRIDSARAYSSIMDKNARWPFKNFHDVVNEKMRGQKAFNFVVMSAPTVDISNLNTERLTQRQCEEGAVKSSQNMISLA